MKVLFLTWDGPESFYLEGLFLPIFKALSEKGYSFHIIQFTWADSCRISLTKNLCNIYGCEYQSIKIIRKPIAFGGFITAFIRHYQVIKYIKNNKINIVMARSIMPALITLFILRKHSIGFIFDADGLPLDERVEFSGMSPFGLIYRFLRDIESQAVRRANSILTRSLAASETLKSRAGSGSENKNFLAFNNGRDSDEFKPRDIATRNEIRDSLQIKRNSPVVLYVGSLGGKYLLDEMLVLFSLIKNKRDDAFFLIITGSISTAEQHISKFPDLQDSIKVITIPSEKISEYISIADVGLSLIKRSYSMHAASAIKTGEYLLSGVPVIGTTGIGESETICSEAGFAISDTSDEHLHDAAEWFVSRVIANRQSYREVSRSVGEKYYSIYSVVRQFERALNGIS